MKKFLTVLVAVLLCVTACFSLTACGTDNSKDWEYIQEKGEMIVGYTVYDPFAYNNENNQLVGFDVELAQAVANKLGINVKFQIIEWKSKVTEINGKNIDVIWNAMTITDELKQSIDISDAYCKNNQAVVVKAGDEAKFTTKELIKNSGEKIAYESGSSAQAVVEADDVLKSVSQTKATDQISALTEVASGTSKIAIVDVLLYDSLKAKANSVVNEQNLVKITDITFPAEEFGIGFRKGSNFKQKVEEALASLKADGTYETIVEKYNLVNNMI